MAESKKCDVEMCIQSMALRVGGPGKKPAESNHAVTVELIWPRNGIQKKSYTRLVKLQGNACAFTDADWVESILLKETVSGRFAIKATVSQALSDSAVEKLLRAVAKSAASSVADVVEDQAGDVVGKVAASPFDFLAALMADGAASTVAQAVVTLNSSDIPEGGRVLTLPLESPARVTQASVSTLRRNSVRSTLIKKGDLNGTVSLSIKAV